MKALNDESPCIDESIKEGEVIQVILNGLLDAHADIVQSIAIQKNLPSLMDLQEILINEEYRLQARGGSTSTLQEDAMFTKGKFKGKTESKWSKGQDQVDASSSGKEKDRSKLKCFYGGIKGHFSSECDKKKRDQGDKQGNLTLDEDGLDVQDANDDAFVMSSCMLANDEDLDPWWIDSGASSHMTFHKEYFTSLLAYGDDKRVIYMTNDGECAIKGIGTIPISLSTNRNVHLEDVLFIPSITKNLLSVSQMLSKGLRVEFDGVACLIKTRREGGLVAGEKER
ncbi:hypothetical protein O6H91_Y036400 [Diphasiastrum complanatum]|nr:hypothetical protein O6H91_Y036400 [Diphasiastrum complanatum]